MFRVAKVATQEMAFGTAIEQLYRGSSSVSCSSIRLELNWPPNFALCPVNSYKHSHGEVYCLRDVVETQKEEHSGIIWSQNQKCIQSFLGTRSNFTAQVHEPPDSPLCG